MAVILVVEDEENIRKGIVKLLQEEQHQVLQAAAGKEALDLIDREGRRTNIVLLDIILPDISGIEVLKKIKASYFHIDVIMVTVFKDFGTAVNCLKEGAYDYVAKPFIPEDLLATIKRAIEKEGIERSFCFYSDRMEKTELDFERRKILFQELAMRRKLEGTEIPLAEYSAMIHPDAEKRLEGRPWEEWEKEIQDNIKTRLKEQPPEVSILAVEDDTSIREGILAVLKEAGYKATGAGSAAEALSALGKAKFDVILLDIILPDRTGMDILPEIKKISPQSHVIMATVLRDIQTAVSAMKLGAYDYVAKPFMPDELLAVINRAVSISATKARIRWMIEQMKKEHLSEDLRKELFRKLLEKRKAEGEKILMDDVFAFFPELRGDWAEKDWKYPLEAIEGVGLDEMVKRFKEQKRRWDDVVRQSYNL